MVRYRPDIADIDDINGKKTGEVISMIFSLFLRQPFEILS
jgi:hypothetical protein